MDREGRQPQRAHPKICSMVKSSQRTAVSFQLCVSEFWC
jgi:hypothetical protein